MDWDDEDEKTSIYDRGGSDDSSARSLLASAAPPPPAPAAGAPARSLAPPPRMSTPAPPTRPTNRPPQPMAVPGVVPAPTPAPQIAPQYREKRSSALYVVLGAAVVAAIAAAWFLWPRTGSLVVTVSGPGNKPLDAVEILVNGNRKCASSPCTIDGLKSDTYYVRAHAAGYQAMADIAVVVSPSAKAVQNLTLVRALGTGVKVLGEGAGLKLYVDEREVGPLPQEIKDMEPGQHAIKVSGGDRLESFEQKITVEPETMQTIGPLKLHVLKGLATILPGNGADGAKVILISGSDRRTLPKLPITLDIPTNQPHTLVATRRGYDQFKLPIKFEDGQVERTFEVALSEIGSSAAPAPPTTPAPAPAAPSRPIAAAPAPAPAPAAGSATLNINAIPMSTVLVDSRPVGQTPRMGLKVSAGSHTVTFMHGEDRKSVPVTVGAGETKTVAVRF
jgi:serine/threonine-protein kinase